MRRQMAITLVLCAAGLILNQPVLAQQPSAGARQIISKVVPRYPELARPMRLEGSVKVMVVVAPNGSPKSIKSMGGHPLLLKAAQDAISSWKWIPAGQETTEFVEMRFRPD